MLMRSHLYFTGEPALGYGWGTVNLQLLKELSLCVPVTHIEENHQFWNSQSLDGDVFGPLNDHTFAPFAPCRGKRNYGCSFFEVELSATAQRNSKRYDLIFAGSTWSLDRMRDMGILNTRLLIQGVDTRLFCCQGTPRITEAFRIFSGGKLELRKGQDLLMAAFRVLQDKYPRMTLVTAWFNLWQGALETLASSPYIRFEWINGTWEQQLTHLLLINGIDPQRVVILPLLHPEKLADVYRSTDLGVFPNRCEGGTNLVMMEYMACGLPVIASYTSGHTDIVTDLNALCLKDLQDIEVEDPELQIMGRWQQPTVDDLIASIEFAYSNREVMAQKGSRAGQDLSAFTWARTADIFLKATGGE